ncbi:hypothetical protein L7F22_003983 [Adiantum nelumboides]|nr:hypothetical protein [Adiantum nelumboides]
MGDAMKANGAFINQKVSVTPLIGKLRLHIQGYVDKEYFFISPLKHEDVILGAPWFDRLAASIKFPERKISFQLREKDMYINAQESSSSIPLANDQAFDKSIKSSISTYMIFVKDFLNGVDETQVNENGMQVDLELSNFLNQFQDVFIDDIPGELPPKRGDDDHMIELIPGSSPPNKPPYRVSQAQQEEIMRQVNELVEKGMVRPSSSPFCSPVLLVIDLKSGYHQIRIVDEDIVKTAFRTTFGLYEYLVMPFGLTNAHATFNCMMERIFRPHRNFTGVFFDDVIIYSKTIEEHKEHLKVIFQALRDNKLYVNQKKSDFFLQEIQYLGHIISKNESADPLEVEGQEEVLQPESVLRHEDKVLRNGKIIRRYLIKFKHYPFEDAKWMQGTQLKDSLHLVNAYNDFLEVTACDLSSGRFTKYLAFYLQRTIFEVDKFVQDLDLAYTKAKEAFLNSQLKQKKAVSWQRKCFLLEDFVETRFGAVMLPKFYQNRVHLVDTGKGKAGLKFQALRSQVVSSLPSAPPPGPATFIAECLEVLQNIGPPHDEGLSHMLISALCQSNRSNWPDEDASIARRLGGSLFCKALVGEFRMDSRIVVKLPIAFHFDLKDIGNILIPGQSEEVLQVNAAKQFVELYLMDLLKRQLYTGAVSLIKNFGLQTCDYQDLIAEIVDDGQANLAIEWAVHLGKDMLKFLVQHCTETGLYKVAYKVVQQHKLEAEFPDAYHLYRQSSLHKLVGKGLWDVAQSIAEGDALLIDYLVILAMKDNDAEKVVELSERFHLDISPLSPDTESSNKSSVYLQLESVVSKDKIYWIDSHEGLQFAERALFGVKLVGIDCEWKPDSVRGASPNKVSILQVASSDLVLVLDLISLLKNCQSSLNTFIGYLFHAPDILKLGYAVHNDLERLSRSFVEIDAFRLCESVLDLQTAFGRQFKGGLSGLAKVFLGSSLNKQTRMSDWEMRPLSKKQLHYAALDAAVLLPIFYSIADYSPATEKLQGWESHVTCYRMLHKWKGDKESVRTTDLPNSDESMIGSHEELVAPAELEAVLLSHPDIEDAASFAAHRITLLDNRDTLLWSRRNC